MLVTSPLHMAISLNHHAMNLRSIQSTFWILLCTAVLLVLPTHQQSAAPGPREGHCSFGFKDNFYVFGGRAQPNASRFSTVGLPIPPTENNTVPWTAMPTNGSYNIVNGSCEVIPSGHAVFLGFDPDDPQAGPTPGFQTYNMHTQSWVTTPTNGSDISQAFGARQGMATVVFEHLIVVFGGEVSGTNTQDTFVLDTSLGIHQWIWKYIPPDQNTPLPSSFVDLSVARQKILYIGLETNANGTKNDVLYSFDPVKLAWEGKMNVLGVDFDRLQVGNYKNSRLFMLPTTMDPGDLSEIHFNVWELQLWNNVALELPNVTHIFEPRIGASVAVVNKTNFVIYGGYNGTRLGDLYVFDMALRQFIYWNIPTVVLPSHSPTPTIGPSNLPYINTGSNDSALGLILGLVIGLVAIFALCFYFVYYRWWKSRQNRLYSVPYNSIPPGQDIAAIAAMLSDKDPEKADRPDETSSNDSGGIGPSQQMEEQDIGMIPMPGTNPSSLVTSPTHQQSKIRSYPTPGGEERIGEHRRSSTLPDRISSRFQEMLVGVLPSMPSRSNTISAATTSQSRSRPPVETLAPGERPSFTDGAANSRGGSSATRSGNGTEVSEESDPPRFRRSW